MFSMLTSSFTSISLFYTQLVGVLKHTIRDLRTGCGRWVVYVFMRGGEGRARLLGLGQDFFSKPNTVADFSLFSSSI